MPLAGCSWDRKENLKESFFWLLKIMENNDAIFMADRRQFCIHCGFYQQIMDKFAHDHPSKTWVVYKYNICCLWMGVSETTYTAIAGGAHSIFSAAVYIAIAGSMRSILLYLVLLSILPSLAVCAQSSATIYIAIAGSMHSILPLPLPLPLPLTELDSCVLLSPCQPGARLLSGRFARRCNFFLTLRLAIYQYWYLLIKTQISCIKKRVFLSSKTWQILFKRTWNTYIDRACHAVILVWCPIGNDFELCLACIWDASFSQLHLKSLSIAQQSQKHCLKKFWDRCMCFACIWLMFDINLDEIDRIADQILAKLRFFNLLETKKIKSWRFLKV